MKKYLTLVVMLAVVLSIGLMIGCEESNPVVGGGTSSGSLNRIEIRTQFNTLRGFMGDERTMTVTAIAWNAQSVAMSGVPISFAIQGSEAWRGAITRTSETDSTDLNGQLLGQYSVILEQSGTVTIQARSGNVTGSKTINLEVLEEVVQISIEGPTVISARPNTSRQATITAIVSDNEGSAVEGVEVEFSTNPTSHGTVDSDTGVTDFNGRVTKTFSTVPNRYGTCLVTAKIGDSTAVHDIEIIPVSEPAQINLHSDTPTISVAEDQNATIDLFAVVTDINRVGVPGAKVEFLIEPYIPNGTTFGAISIADTVDETDNNGLINAHFRTLGGDGRVYVVARVLPSGGTGDPISARMLLKVDKLPTVLGGMTLRAQPSFLRMAPDTVGTSMIFATVSNLSGVGLPNVVVDFQVDVGYLSNVTITDSTGLATAKYTVVPDVDFPNPDEQRVVATVVASLPGTATQKTAQITIEKFSSDVGTLQLFASTNVIYADGGVTRADLQALLKDADGQVMSGKQITFTSDHGTVNSPVMTDSSGVARAVFSDIGLPSVDENNNPVPALIFARYGPMELEAWVEITILEQNPIGQITLITGSNDMIAGRGDSTSVTATCLQENGDRAPDGTQVTFTCIRGRFTADQVYVSGGIGQAQSFYISGSRSGVDILRAFVVNNRGESVDTVWSNEVLITLRPGSPSRVSVDASPRVLPTNDPNAFSEITATVTDTVSNPVAPGTLVNFVSTLGVIPASAVTDTLGQAKVRLTAGVNSGYAEVTATVQSPAGPIEGRTTVQFVAGNPNSIELTADPLEIQVRGTGGIESATLTATVRDPNGNLIGGSVPVYFELIRQPPEPRGCNINDRGSTDSALTANGIARATLNSGTQSGAVLIRAYTWRDPDTRLNLVEVTNSTVQVVAGPPDLLDIDVNDDGEDAGGGAWSVEVSARVYDFYRNPVANRIPVAFTVDPDIATIAPGHTGNEGRNGVPTAGLAYAEMIYNSNNTFDTLEITAVVETEEGAREGQHTHTLPLQEGSLQLNVAPQNRMFDRNEPDDVATITCFVVLTDGHQILINNGPILFTSSRGGLWYRDFQGRYHEYEEPMPAIKYTGWRPPRNPGYNEQDGQATVFLRGVMDDFFLDPFTLEVTVQIDAGVVGYDDVTADPGFVFMTRH